MKATTLPPIVSVRMRIKLIDAGPALISLADYEVQV